MVVKYFDVNVHIVFLIFQLFDLPLIPFIKFYIIEINLVSSLLDCFVQEIVLLVVIGFIYIW